MERIYANPGMARRGNGSLIVVIVAFVFGMFEIWRAAAVGGNEAGTGYLFAAFFIGGGIYAFRQLMTSNRDSVAWLDVGPDGQATVAVWQPFSTRRLGGPVERLTGWRAFVKEPRRNMKVRVVLADHPDHPRPLEFEVGQGVKAKEKFRALAADAASAFAAAGSA